MPYPYVTNDFNTCVSTVKEVFGENLSDAVIVYKDKKSWKTLSYSDDNLAKLCKRYLCVDKWFHKYIVMKTHNYAFHDIVKLEEVIGICPKEEIECIKPFMIHQFLEIKQEDIRDTEDSLKIKQEEAEELKKELDEQNVIANACSKEYDRIMKKLSKEKDTEVRYSVTYFIPTGIFKTTRIVLKKKLGHIRDDVSIDEKPDDSEMTWIGQCVESKLEECKKMILEAYMQRTEAAMRKENPVYFKARDLLSNMAK